MIYPFLLSRNESTLEVKKNIYFLLEGKNTEQFYFDGLLNDSDFKPYDNVSIYSFIKGGSDEGLTQPIKMIEKAISYANDKINKFNKNIDKIYVIFDLDVFKNDNGKISSLKKYRKYKYIKLGYSNPAFELFLLLHLDEAYTKYIAKYKSKILSNEYYKGKRFINYLLSEVTGINPKSNELVSVFAKNYKNAIKEEKSINEILAKAYKNVTCNVAKLIDELDTNY